jgi:hypothetical protein
MMIMPTRKCFTLLVLLLAVMLFVFIGCSELEEAPATPIEIPYPAAEENQEEDPNPEATPIEIPSQEPDEEEEPIQTSD